MSSPKNITPFKMWCLGNFPFIEKTLDAIDNYSLWCKIVEKLNEVIENENNVTSLVNEMKNWFDNLDVQEEINTKLDEMAEDGTLEELIAKYIDNISRTYNTLTEMKSANLSNNIKVKTLGYYQIGDNGGAEYYITSTQPSTGYAEILDNGNYAKLIVGESIIPEQVGAYANGTQDDTQALTKAIEIAFSSEVPVELTSKTYKLTSLTITSPITINGNNATLTDTSSVDKFITITYSSGSNRNIFINDLIIESPNSNVGLYVEAMKLFGSNIKITNSKEINMQVKKVGSYGSTVIDNLTSHLTQIGLQLDATDCFISNFHGYNCMTHIKINGGLTHLNTIHGWNLNSSTTDWITGSTLIDTQSNVIGNDIYIDTLENGIVLPTAHPYTSITLQNVSYFLNTSSYPETQQAPTLLKNVENYTGFCKIDGFFGDENGWHDSEGNYPTLIDDIPLSRVSITNVSNSGFRFGNYKPIITQEDIAITSYTLDLSTYVSLPTRKVMIKDYNIHAYIVGSMKTSCPTGTIMAQVTFTGQTLDRLTYKTRVQAKFVESSNVGVVYDLPAFINDSHQLTIYNNSGISLGSSGHYGTLYVYIDDIYQTK